MTSTFLQLFKVRKPVITVLHGRGGNDHSVLENAKREIEIFAANGINGLLVENYFCTPEQAEMVLEYLSSLHCGVPIGINLLGNDKLNFRLAQKYACDFMQLDSVSGHLTPEDDIDFGNFIQQERSALKAKIIGGVRFKYQPYKSGRTLEEDMQIALMRCDAIAVTGDLTGQETNIDKIKSFRALLPKTPLIVAAGTTPQNIKEQLAIGDACIVGSYFKEEHNVENAVNEHYVREFMEKIKQVRNAD